MLPRLLSARFAGIAASPMHMDARPMSQYVRANISRMLSNNPSRIVDVSHQKDLERGVTTSGETLANLNTPDSIADPARAAARAETGSDALGAEDQQMAENIRETIGKSQGSYMGQSKRHPEFSTGPVADQIRMANERMKEQTTPMDSSIDAMEKKNRQQSSSSQRQEQDKTDDDPWKQRDHPEELLDEQAMHPAHDKVRGLQVAARVEEAWNRTDPYEKSIEQKGQVGPKPVDRKDDIPGTGRLSGTRDNFDDDPAVSLGQIKDAATAVKDTVAESTVGQMAQDLRKAVKDSPMRKEAKETIKSSTVGQTLKGMKDVAKNTVKEATIKAKEFITGEREVEKPDESKSEVRTSRGSYRRGEQQKSIEERKQQQTGRP